MPDPAPFDVAIVGAGVVGCALARRLVLDGARVVVLEKAPDILDGASKANSAILHTGFDAPEGTLEATCVAAGHAEYLEIRERLNLPLLTSGALVLAWTEAEAAALPGLMAQAVANGVTDVAALSPAEAARMEPGLASGVTGAFRVPREYLIDPWSAPLAYLTQAVGNGAVLMRGTEVAGGRHDDTGWTLDTSRGAVRALRVVNCAGLWGDVLDRRLTGDSDFAIRPRKGQFIVYDKPAFRLTRHILLPVPTATTKGVVVCRTIWGNLLVGPTAEEQADRDTAALDPAVLTLLRAKGEAILPALAREEVTAVYAGLRPATEEKPYRVRHRPEIGYLTLGGIRSTGLSAALGLARYAADLLSGGWSPLADPTSPRMPMLAETETRDWQAPGAGGMVCHCELVTRREVEAALSGPLGAVTLAGLKRRTRVTMGRCQGFHCLPKLAEIAGDRLVPPMAAE